MEVLIFYILFIIVVFIYIFTTNYVGQQVTDYNNHIFFTAYNIQWYAASLKVQKLILFLLQRGSKSFIVKVGGLFEGSLKCFASMTSASVSYFTVIYSTQK
ncbi:hypothetical protein HN011_001081 [Eciton burchellii]|nr:hypothetical protein HN011_001081 [Eciton burchellii]